jgi:hypothetical protein
VGAVAAVDRDEVARVDRVSTSSICRFCRWTEANDVALVAPAAVTRDVLERYRADVFLLDRSPGRKSGLLTDLKVFLDDVRLHEWVVGLPANATYYRGEIPRDRQGCLGSSTNSDGPARNRPRA